MRQPSNVHEAICFTLEEELPLLLNLPFLDKVLGFHEYEQYREVLDSGVVEFNLTLIVEDLLPEIL